MEFIQLAGARYSLRGFSDKPVEKEKLDLILEAGRLAPTACNNQPQRIIALEGEALAQFTKRVRALFGAPAALVVCYDRTASWKRGYDGKDSGDIDASIVATHMMLQAAELGLGTTWVGHFDPAAAVAALGLPADIVPVALLPLGYPAADAVPRAGMHDSRKPVAETVFYNHLS